MSTLVKQGTTTMEAQEGTPTLGLLAPQPDQTDKMDQWTAKILIIAGSIGTFSLAKTSGQSLTIYSWSFASSLHHSHHTSLATGKETV